MIFGTHAGRGPLLFVLLAAAAVCAALAPRAGAAISPERTHGPLSPTLAALARPGIRALAPAAQARAVGVAASGPGSLLRRNGTVLVYVAFRRNAQTPPQAVERSGAHVVNSSRRFGVDTVRVSPADLHSLAAVPGVSSVTPVRAPIVRAPDPCKGGSVISEGVEQLEVEAAREAFGVEGEGMTVGILSDSLNQAKEAVPGGPVASKEPADILSKDLPGRRNTCPGQGTAVEDLEDYIQAPGEEEPFDEGRAMLQTVHDVAPKAELAFHSAFNGELDFAEGIEELAKPVVEGGGGAQVIADDVGYFEEPFFQEGPVAAAVDSVTEAGATYLSAAGNDNLFDQESGLGEEEIASWEAPAFRDSGDCPAEVRALEAEAFVNAHHCLDFDPRPGRTDRTFGIKVEPGEVLSVDLQWAEPRYGVSTDLDAYLLDSEGHLLTGSAEDNAKTKEPVEIVQWTNESGSTQTVQLVINRFSGSGARLKFMLLEDGGGVSATEYPRSGGGDVVGPTIYGHAGARGAIAVGAVNYGQGKTPSEPEEYSSRGPVVNYFGPVEGETPAAPLAEPEVLSKPDVVATDCGRTTFFAEEPKAEPGIWRFCGTSAAAPHAAGVTALMLEAEGAAEPAEVREALAATATPVGSFDSCAVGGGMVEAKGAVEALFPGPPPPAPEPCEPPESPPAVFVAPGSWGLEAPPPPAPPVEPKPVPKPSAPAPEEKPKPPNTFLAKHPAKKVRIRGRSVKLAFGFRSDQEGVTFLCKIDSSPFKPCGAKLNRRFRLGSHIVRVKARSAAGLIDSTPAVYRFRVVRRS